MYSKQCVSLVILFWGEVGKFCPSWLSRVSGLARRNLSPTWENYLGTVVRAVRACEIWHRKRPSRARNGHIAWYRLRLRVGDHLRSI